MSTHSDDLAARLPGLLPKAIAWAQEQSEVILRAGLPLDTPELLEVARAVGVRHPERIRILMVPEVPAPADPELRELAARENLVGRNTGGLTLGYGIFIRNGTLDLRLLSHECRHVHQVEVAGSLDIFLPLYLGQIAQYGYDDAPYEVDARAHELTAWPT